MEDEVNLIRFFSSLESIDEKILSKKMAYKQVCQTGGPRARLKVICSPTRSLLTPILTRK
jgi:hypothetical protein